MTYEVGQKLENRSDVDGLPRGAVVVGYDGVSRQRALTMPYVFQDGAPVNKFPYTLVYLPEVRTVDLTDPETLAWEIYKAFNPNTIQTELSRSESGDKWRNVAKFVQEYFIPLDTDQSSELKGGDKVKVLGPNAFDDDRIPVGAVGTVLYDGPDDDGDYLVTFRDLEDESYFKRHNLLKIA